MLREGRAPMIGGVSRPTSDENSLCRPYAMCHISVANSPACASIDAGHQPDARAPQSPSPGTSSVLDLADAASSVGAGQDRCCVTTIETTAPRRARHRGQRSTVRKGARTRTLSPQLGQCIYDKRISSTRLYMCAAASASATWVADERTGSALRSSPRSCLVSALDTRVRVEAAPKSRLLHPVLSRRIASGSIRCPDADVGVKTVTRALVKPGGGRRCWPSRPSSSTFGAEEPVPSDQAAFIMVRERYARHDVNSPRELCLDTAHSDEHTA